MARAAARTVERQAGAVDRSMRALGRRWRRSGRGVSAPRFWARATDLLASASAAGRGDYGAATRGAWRGPGEVSAPVVCVGNFVVGGAGKTPTAMAIARLLIAAGGHVAFLSRGYGGTRAEPLLVDPYAHAAARRRRTAAAGARRAMLRRRGPGAAARARSAAGGESLVMDDGLQNPGLAKDLAFAVVDAEAGFGNGLCVPAAPCARRSRRNCRSSDALIAIGGGDRGRANSAAPLRGKPILRARLRPDAASPPS